MSRFDYLRENQPASVDFDYDPTSHTLRLGESTFACDGQAVWLEGRRIPFWVHQEGQLRWVWLQGEVYRFESADPRRRNEQGGPNPAAGGMVKAQMPGKVLTVSVQVGDQVEKGQNLLLMESMKMELSLDAPLTGKVKRVEVTPNQMVAQGELLVELES